MSKDGKCHAYIDGGLSHGLMTDLNLINVNLSGGGKKHFFIITFANVKLCAVGRIRITRCVPALPADAGDGIAAVFSFGLKCTL